MATGVQGHKQPADAGVAAITFKEASGEIEKKRYELPAWSCTVEALAHGKERSVVAKNAVGCFGHD